MILELFPNDTEWHVWRIMNTNLCFNGWQFYWPCNKENFEKLLHFCYFHCVFSFPNKTYTGISSTCLILNILHCTIWDMFSTLSIFHCICHWNKDHSSKHLALSESTSIDSEESSELEDDEAGAFVFFRGKAAVLASIKPGLFFSHDLLQEDFTWSLVVLFLMFSSTFICRDWSVIFCL